jgi:hypothetical protein
MSGGFAYIAKPCWIGQLWNRTAIYLIKQLFRTACQIRRQNVMHRKMISVTKKALKTPSRRDKSGLFLSGRQDFIYKKECLLSNHTRKKIKPFPVGTAWM